jgi:hypothetical protein
MEKVEGLQALRWIMDDVTGAYVFCGLFSDCCCGHESTSFKLMLSRYAVGASASRGSHAKQHYCLVDLMGRFGLDAALMALIAES